MKTIIVPKITCKDEINHLKSTYPSAHRLGNKAEIKVFGKSQYDYLNRKIQKLPKNHWAATHTKKGNIHLSQELLDIIPKNMQSTIKKELKCHEKNRT